MESNHIKTEVDAAAWMNEQADAAGIPAAAEVRRDEHGQLFPEHTATVTIPPWLHRAFHLALECEMVTSAVKTVEPPLFSRAIVCLNVDIEADAPSFDVTG